MENDEIKEIKLEVEEIINKLLLPLSEDERSNGWNEGKQKFMLDFYYSLLNELNKKSPYLNKPEYMGIYIRMDYAGISGGELEDKGGRISYLIRNYNSKRKIRNIVLKIKKLLVKITGVRPQL